MENIAIDVSQMAIPVRRQKRAQQGEETVEDARMTSGCLWLFCAGTVPCC